MRADIFAGSTVLITGASSGIGAALAVHLAATGAHLVLTARDPTRLGEVASRVRTQGGRVDSMRVDLTDPGAITSLLRQLGERNILVDHLMNNAGIGVQGRGVELPVEDQIRVIDLNIRAATELALHLLPGMVGRGRGGILNIASTAAFQGLPGLSVYAGTKAYLLTWSEALHRELRGTGVRCACLCPGPVETRFFETGAMRRPHAVFPMQTPEAAAEAGLRAYARNASHSIPGLANRATAWMTRLAPRALAVLVAGGFARPRGDS